MDNQIVYKKDLKTGDILLYGPIENNALCELICALTDSPVSHTAMMYYDTDHIIEETLPQVTIGECEASANGRTVYVIRHNDSSLDMTKVIDIAQFYYDQKTPYPLSNLFVVGTYLVLSKHMPNKLSQPIQKLLTTLLYIASGELMKLINKKQFKDKHPMVCSQFAYVCYKQAGPEYKLQLKMDSTCNCLLGEIKSWLTKSWLTMKDEVDWLADETLLAQYSDVSENEKELLLQQIHKELTENGHNANDSFTKPFVAAVAGFLKQLAIAFGLMTKEELAKISLPDLIDELMGLEEYFVSPGDLYDNCTNAAVIGVLDV